MSATRSKPEIREEASRRLIAVLDGSLNPYKVLAELGDVLPPGERAVAIAEPVYRAMSDLVSTRDDLSRLMTSATRAMADAETFIRGGSARFNSLGILQADGPRIDVLCAIFHERVERAVDALFEALSEIDRITVDLGSAADDAECDDDAECEGHPAGPSDPMGETVYCDGSCRSSSPRPGVFDLRRELGRAPTAEEYRDAGSSS